MERPFFNIYIKTALNFNSLRAVKVILSQDISNHTFTLFPCHIVFLSVHIGIYRSVDSFHLYTTKII